MEQRLMAVSRGEREVLGPLFGQIGGSPTG